MTDTTPSRLGQVNAGGDVDALFLKKWAGEVMAAFEEANVIAPLHLVRTIENGKSAQFPAAGRAAAMYHTAGENILDPTNGLLSLINHAERVIFIDDKLLAASVIDELDELKNHYDVRSLYTGEHGQALATKMDQQLLQVAVLTARESATVTGLPGGTGIVNATYQSGNGDTALQTHFDAAAIFDANSVPDRERYSAIPPVLYYKLVQQVNLLDRDLNEGGNGVFADGTVFKAAGIQLVKTNNLPTAIVAADAGEKNTYDGDFTGTLGVMWHRSAFGSVWLRNLVVESDYKTEYQGTLMVSSLAVGHGPLRPESAIEVKAA